MKWVRLSGNNVAEIIPDAATVPSVAHWYGEAFAAQCVQAPDDVEQRMVYDAETGTFSDPPEPEEPEEPEEEITLDDVLEYQTDLDYRINLLEMGVTE